MNKEYDVIIIGAGPAGMFAANELAGRNLKILIIDQGPDIKQRHCQMIETKVGKCVNCAPCSIMCGVGGSGTYSDGTLNLRPDIGGDLTELTNDQEVSWDIVKRVDDVFLKFGATTKKYGADKKEIERLKREAAAAGIKFIDIIQRHMGSDNAPQIIERFAENLKDNGVQFMLKTKVGDLLIKDGVAGGVELSDGRKIKSRYVLLAPGRVGAQWTDEVVRKHGIKFEFGPIDVGVRVEVPAIIMDPITAINRDPKFHIRSDRYDDFVRTFCTNHHGFVVKESYDGFIGVNGHSMHNKESENTNFAFLVQVHLTKPLENTIKYGRSIAKLATTIGGGRPIVQRFGDLRRGRRSTPERIADNPVRNTLKDVTPGDISMALPHRIAMDIIEGLEKLDKVIPGVASGSTLLYAPEIKFYATKVGVDKNMETNIKNLFAAGDGCGLSRDIVNAAATGILAGGGILKISKA